jgi:hypothetical protein
MAGGRDERVIDLFFLDQTSAGDPSEEGLVRRVDNDLVTYIDGAVKSLTVGSFSASQVGQILISTDGSNITNEQPLTSLTSGWLINDSGELMVVG